MKELPVSRLEPGYLYSITFSCHKKIQLFVDSYLFTLLEKSVSHARDKHKLYLIAWVMMPNHTHILLSVKSIVHTPDLARDIKQKVGFHGVNFLKSNHPALASQIEVSTGTTRTSRFWLHRTGHVRRIDSIEKVHTVIDYIHRNPERWGLVRQPEDWFHSSAGYWILNRQSGLIPNPPDWLSDRVE